jgi:2-oxoglutarate ferredoxin oxidoreductase subunit alpha
MSETLLMKGNEALAEAAMRAGLQAYFGYPITPQSEILEYLAMHFAPRGGVVVQAESELAAISMVYGAAGAGARTMTTSSSPGISLMQEGLSYIAAAELPCVIANVMRAGPGLGNIQAAQSDYFQATKGGGNGDYHLIVLAPASVQEMADFVFDGFALADRYRNPVMILSDGALGQMMEKVVLRAPVTASGAEKTWATTGKPQNRPRNIVTTIHLQPEVMEQFNRKLQAKYQIIRSTEQRCELFHTEDAKQLIVAFGISARIAKKTVELARQQGLRLGLLRPITLWPFPSDALTTLAAQVEGILVVEMNAGQMTEDVKLAVEGRTPVKHFGYMGGILPSPEEVLGETRQMIKQIQDDLLKSRREKLFVES